MTIDLADQWFRFIFIIRRFNLVATTCTHILLILGRSRLDSQIDIDSLVQVQVQVQVQVIRNPVAIRQ